MDSWLLVSLFLAPLLGTAARGTDPEEVLTADLDPAGRLLAEGRNDGVVVLRDLESGRTHELVPAFADPCWKACFDPTGDRLAVLDHRNRLTVWTLVDGQGISSWSDRVGQEVPGETPYSLSFPGGVGLSWSDDGLYLAARASGVRAIWSRKGERLRQWDGGPRPRWSGHELWLPLGRSLQVWSVDGDRVELSRSLELEEDLESFALGAEGDVVWTGHPGGRVCRRDGRTAEVLAEHVLPDLFADEEENDWIARIEVSPDGNRLACSMAPSVHVRVLDGRSMELVHDSDFLSAHFGEAMEVTWSPDGERVFAAFPCSKDPLRWFSPDQPGGVKVTDRAVLPIFRGEVGVVLVRRRARRIAPDGKLLP